MTLFFCGDIMPGGVLPYQDQYISNDLLEYMHGFDFRIGTLEAAIGNDLPFDPIKMDGRQNIIYARDADLSRLKSMGFDVVSLANNHVWDLGEKGLENTIRQLTNQGIKYCGAGMNAIEASRPAVIEKGGVKVAIFAYCMTDNKYLGHVEQAGEDKAGVNPLVIDRVLKDIKKAKQNYDRVIVMPHWGREYTYEPLPKCISMAKQMINAGADAVLGSHTHQIQPLVHYKDKPICFSMGNFLFPDFYMQPPRPIWYPDNTEDLASIKTALGYPFPITEPIRQIWNPVSRYGCIIGLGFNELTLNESIQSVHLSEYNVESLSELPLSIHSHLQKAEEFVLNLPLRLFSLGRRCSQKLLRLSIKVFRHFLK